MQVQGGQVAAGRIGPVNGTEDHLADSRTPGMSILWLVLVVLVADQISKYVVTVKMSAYGPPIEILGTFFRLTYIHNRGAAFGLNLGSPLVHTVVSIAALALLVYLFWTLPAGARLLRAALAMVLGGALGNIVDRIRLEKGVVDFLDFGIGEQWRWPVFNVADSFVTVGIVLLAVGYSRKDKTGARESSASGTSPATPPSPVAPSPPPAVADTPDQTN